MIRPATLSDIADIIELAVESVSRDPLPVVIDPSAMRDMARNMIGRPQHFVWVAEHEGRVCACVAAMTQEGFWFHKQQASVLLFYARQPGAGALLLRQLSRWVESRPVIKLAVIELEPGVDPRIVSLMRKLGFDRPSTNLTYVRKPS